jgi:hypothetical protein
VATLPDDPQDREQDLLRALRTEISRLDDDTRQALGSALDDDRLKLAGGWGDREDGEGCVLSIAAWNMGLSSGEALMYRSVAAVRIPALFDELWALLLTRLGDVEQSRDAARRLLGDALAAADDRPRVAVSSG